MFTEVESERRELLCWVIKMKITTPIFSLRYESRKEYMPVRNYKNRYKAESDSEKLETVYRQYINK